MPHGAKYAGRKKGTPNKVSRSMKDTVADTLQWLQTQPRSNMREWAKENPTAFYQIAAKLIPTEIVGKDGDSLIPIGTVKIIRSGGT